MVVDCRNKILVFTLHKQTVVDCKNDFLARLDRARHEITLFFIYFFHLLNNYDYRQSENIMKRVHCTSRVLVNIITPKADLRYRVPYDTQLNHSFRRIVKITSRHI